MLEAMVAVVPPDYSHIIDLDKLVRDFGVPALLDDHKSHSISPRFLVMQRGLVAISRELGMSPFVFFLSPTSADWKKFKLSSNSIGGILRMLWVLQKVLTSAIIMHLL